MSAYTLPEDHYRARPDAERPDAAELADYARELRTAAARRAERRAQGLEPPAVLDDPWAPGSPYRTR